MEEIHAHPTDQASALQHKKPAANSVIVTGSLVLGARDTGWNKKPYLKFEDSDKRLTETYEAVFLSLFVWLFFFASDRLSGGWLPLVAGCKWHWNVRPLRLNLSSRVAAKQI